MGLQKILSLLEAEDNDVRIHAVKVVANLAAEGDFISLPCSFSLPCYCHLHAYFLKFSNSMRQHVTDITCGIIVSKNISSDVETRV